jgi:hypothetical protein
LRNAPWIVAALVVLSSTGCAGGGSDAPNAPVQGATTVPSTEAPADPIASSPGTPVYDDHPEPPAPSGETLPPDQVVAATPTPLPDAPAAPAATTDAFGVTMLYPSKSGGETWAATGDLTKDARFNAQNTITSNADGSWKMRNSKVRMLVYTSTGYDGGKIASYDRDVLTSKGFMQAANDWRNVEITGFFKVVSASNATDNIDLYARGGRHTDTDAGCEGSSYKGQIYYDGRTRWAKETWHVSYDYKSYAATTSPIIGRWIGLKAIMQNTTVDGRPAVRLQLWLNENADRVTWKKVYEVVDDGTWGGDASHCGASSNTLPITWGGPIATYRWDNAEDVDFKWLSVREIQ